MLEAPETEMTVEPAPKFSVAFKLVIVAPPVLQTRAPTGKVSGPSVTGLLESSPMTFQVVGAIVRFCADAH